MKEEVVGTTPSAQLPDCVTPLIESTEGSAIDTKIDISGVIYLLAPDSETLLKRFSGKVKMTAVETGEEVRSKEVFDVFTDNKNKILYGHSISKPKDSSGDHLFIQFGFWDQVIETYPTK